MTIDRPALPKSAPCFVARLEIQRATDASRL
jgi:hypothetical protein